MPKKALFILAIFFFSFLKAADCSQMQVRGRLEPIKRGDRILILAPHPDDESIGCAGIIQQALRAGAKIQVCYLTNGDHNEFAFIVYEKRITFRKGEFVYMGGVRKQEAINAMKLLGVDERDLIFLGYPDFGTFAIFSEYWLDSKPYRDRLTRISAVPYKDNPSYESPYVGENILYDLKKVLLDFRPNKIFVSSPADVNVDHKAFYLFLTVALRDLRKDIPAPKIYPYLIHCAGWPLPRYYHPELRLEPPKDFLNSEIRWLNIGLSPKEVDNKYRAILYYKSQTQSSAFYLLSFARQNELFGDFPEIEIKRRSSLRERGVNFFDFSDRFGDSMNDFFIGLEQLVEDSPHLKYSVVDDFFIVQYKKANHLNPRLTILFYFFGYSDKRPFATMPKIRIFAKHAKFKIFNGKKLIDPEGASLKELNSDALILKIPLKALGDPDFILSCVRTYKGYLPEDATGIRKIVISR